MLEGRGGRDGGRLHWWRRESESEAWLSNKEGGDGGVEEVVALTHVLGWWRLQNIRRGFPHRLTDELADCLTGGYSCEHWESEIDKA